MGIDNSEDAGDGDCSARLRRLLTGVSLSLLAAIAIEQFEFSSAFPLARKLMQTQDMPVLLSTAVLLLLLTALKLPVAWTDCSARLKRSTLAVPILAAFTVAALGTKFAAFDYALSRDEAMAVFDAKIIAGGHLLAPIPPEWRPYASALQPEFRLPIPGDVAWVSSYLPGNAAIRATLGFAFPGVIINAVLAVAALVALLGVARQMWPEHRDAAVIAVVLAASSSQLLFMAMTPYAMSAHLALNLIWLWLFLRDTPSAHAGALAVGFLATGLHQFIFHPLFVAPFLLQLLADRRWKLGGVYIACYAAIGLFWILYWQILLASADIAPQAATAMGGSYLASRITSLLSYFSPYGLETMVQNLLRFAAWQNPMMLVLLVPGFAAAWRLGGTLRSLAGGIVLTLAAMFVLLPYQDLGWGYRYVHGLIGNAALLAAGGWLELTPDRNPSSHRVAWGTVTATTAFAVLILLPIHGWQVRTQVAPYALAQASIASDPADAVVIDTIGIYYGNDLVRNDPYLTNRPLSFDISFLNEELVRNLCTRFKLTVFHSADAARFGIAGSDPNGHSEHVRLAALRNFIESPACRDLLRGQ